MALKNLEGARDQAFDAAYQATQSAAAGTPIKDGDAVADMANLSLQEQACDRAQDKVLAFVQTNFPACRRRLC